METTRRWASVQRGSAASTSRSPAGVSFTSRIRPSPGGRVSRTSLARARGRRFRERVVASIASTSASRAMPAPPSPHSVTALSRVSWVAWMPSGRRASSYRRVMAREARRARKQRQSAAMIPAAPRWGCMKHVYTMNTATGKCCTPGDRAAGMHPRAGAHFLHTPHICPARIAPGIATCAFEESRGRTLHCGRASHMPDGEPA